MGHGYFIFSLFCLAFMLMNREKKKEKISLKRGGVCCVSRDACKAQESLQLHGENTLPEGNPQSVWYPCANLGRETDKRRNQISTSSKAPKAIFYNKISRRCQEKQLKIKRKKLHSSIEQIEIQSSS